MEPVPWAEAETFLRTARTGKMTRIPEGVTAPVQVVLTSGERSARAVFKTIDVFSAGLKRFSDGTWEVGFRDSYRHEIAAYELAKLLGLALVPPTVERKIGVERGSLQLWMEDCITEGERMQRGLSPTDREGWNRQIHTVRLLRQLTFDTDFNNVGNLLLDEGFRVYAIDFSRAFRLHGRLLAEGDLTRFSRAVLSALRRLDRKTLDERLARWLSPGQIEGLLVRRDLILERAERLVAERGEDAVLFP